jgi:hypothetical protein
MIVGMFRYEIQFPAKSKHYLATIQLFSVHQISILSLIPLPLLTTEEDDDDDGDDDPAPSSPRNYCTDSSIATPRRPRTTFDFVVDAQQQQQQ